jgi:hypothetical protein
MFTQTTPVLNEDSIVIKLPHLDSMGNKAVSYLLICSKVGNGDVFARISPPNLPTSMINFEFCTYSAKDKIIFTRNILT